MNANNIERLGRFVRENFWTLVSVSYLITLLF